MGRGGGAQIAERTNSMRWVLRLAGGTSTRAGGRVPRTEGELQSSALTAICHHVITNDANRDIVPIVRRGRTRPYRRRSSVGRERRFPHRGPASGRSPGGFLYGFPTP